MFGLSVPWLSNQESARRGDDPSRSFADQVLFLRTMASRVDQAPLDPSDGDEDRNWRVQLRYWTEGWGGKTLRCALFGAARGRYGAEDLLAHLLGALPRSLPLEQLGQDDARSMLRMDTPDLRAVEIRRAIRRGDPRATRSEVQADGDHLTVPQPPAGELLRPTGRTVGGADSARVPPELDPLGVPVEERRDLRVVPWIWSANTLEATLYALVQRQVPTALAVVLSPARLTQRERDHLSVGSTRQDLHASRRDDPLAETLYKAYRGYSREMRESCVEMHVFLASAGELGLWFPKLVGNDLSAGGGEVSGLCVFEAAPVRTRHDQTLVADAIALRRHGGLHRSEAGAVAGLADKFPAWEANVAFRFPVLANDLFIADW